RPARAWPPRRPLLPRHHRVPGGPRRRVRAARQPHPRGLALEGRRRAHRRRALLSVTCAAPPADELPSPERILPAQEARVSRAGLAPATGDSSFAGGPRSGGPPVRGCYWTTLTEMGCDSRASPSFVIAMAKIGMFAC